MKTPISNSISPSQKQLRALLRHEVMCFVTHRLTDGVPLAQCLRDAAARPWPADSGAFIASRTIETWWYDYKREGFQGLSGTPRRSDAEASRSLDQATGLWLTTQLQASPEVPLSVMLRALRKQEQGVHLPSESSVRRFLTAQGMDKRTLRAGRLETGPQKAFEAPSPNDLWMTDFANGPTLRLADGKTLTTHLCLFVDDHSRLITHAAYYPAADTAAFLQGLKQAVLRRGVPHKLYTDQGKPFISYHARFACANLDIRLLHAKPYHAWSKGKVERLIQTIQKDFEIGLRLPGQQVHSLAALNTALAEWVENTYHLRKHSRTDMSPHQRFTQRYLAADTPGGPPRPHPPQRHVEEKDKIDILFYTRTKRVVRKDGTVTLGKKLYEVELTLRALEVELRYDPYLLDTIEVWHRDRYYGHARLADLHHNSQSFSRTQGYKR